MERLSLLIHKLKEQFEQNVPPSQMLGTVRQIEAELSQASVKPANGFGTAKVAVMMPSGVRSESEPVRERSYQPQPSNPAIMEKEVIEKAWAFDPLQEIPTLSHQQGIREINDVIGMSGASMNDHLREERVELAHVLTETPIRDLKKAIGVNDRYVFLNELFRGDEVMYERSLKTLNGFRIYQEAEYWINRELKIKLGWNDNNSVVRHFYQLVRRRFS
ncbi:MAG TPA: hypothetical protein VGD17_10305 [Chitinophagaceae bacterium]